MALTAGTTLGQYEIIDTIGAGGMGEVYRARDTRLNRDVAIKVLPDSLTYDRHRLQRFEQEANAVAASNHPNILAVVNTERRGPASPVRNCWTARPSREPLRRGPLPVRKAVDYGVQIANGLAAAHDNGIVHRDLKPENLFITTDGRIKILDFGLATMVQPDEADSDRAPTLMLHTKPGLVMGTAGYMAPEQVRGKKADARSDIFAFSAILQEMVTGERTFQKPTSAEKRHPQSSMKMHRQSRNSPRLRLLACSESSSADSKRIPSSAFSLPPTWPSLSKDCQIQAHRLSPFVRRLKNPSIAS